MKDITPLPWKVTTNNWIVGSGADVMTPYKTFSSANAHFIVTACNSHAKLLSALEVLVIRARDELADPEDVGELQGAIQLLKELE